MRIVVLAGGLSPERDVSLSSGALIANALIENGHAVMLLDLYLGVRGDIPPVYKDRSSSKRYHYSVPETEPDLEDIGRRADNEGSLMGRGVLELCREADRVFLALHGSIGENGQLQALLDIHGISYTGTGYAGSFLAMDKDISKKLMAAQGIPTAGWRYLDLREEVPANLTLPCVVKPCSCGSSVGISIAETASQLRQALDAARKYEDFIIVEDKIEGREFSVGILGGEALPPIEIKPLSGFYDYKNKYQQGLTQEICPAQVTPALLQLLQDSALAVHKLLRLGFYSRVDFMVDAAGTAYCLEANTLPGMTPTSLLPQEALAAGISYNRLCERIALGE